MSQPLAGSLSSVLLISPSFGSSDIPRRQSREHSRYQIPGRGKKIQDLGMAALVSLALKLLALAALRLILHFALAVEGSSLPVLYRLRRPHRLYLRQPGSLFHLAPAQLRSGYSDQRVRSRHRRGTVLFVVPCFPDHRLCPPIRRRPT